MKKSLSLTIIFICYMQSAYSMEIHYFQEKKRVSLKDIADKKHDPETHPGSFIPIKDRPLINWCSPQDSLVEWYRKETKDTALSRNHFPVFVYNHTTDNEKQNVAIELKYKEFCNLGSNFKLGSELFTNVDSFNMTNLTQALSASAALSNTHPLEFAITVTIDLNSKDEQSIAKAINLIKPSSENERENILKAIRPHLRLEIYNRINDIPIKSSVSPLIKPFLATGIIGLLFYFIFLYKKK